MNCRRILCVLFAALGAINGASAGDLTASYLRCEYRVDPLGIGVVEPRLSWVLESKTNGERQTAFQVLVASTVEALGKDEGDLWDSGRVKAEDGVGVAYAGKPLRSGTWCWWKVRVWNASGEPSDWSAPAHWSMGLLGPDAWTAKWIGDDGAVAASRANNPLEKAKWIWWGGEEGDPIREIPAVIRHFSREFTVNEAPESARIVLTADDHFILKLNGSEIGRSSGEDAWRQPKTIDIKGALRRGTNTVEIEVSNVKPSPCGLIAAVDIKSVKGKVTTITTDKGWESSDKAGGRFVAARELGDNGIEPWKKVGLSGLTLPPVQYLRKSFDTPKAVKRAMLYTTAFGIHEVSINGQRVGDDYFNPGWTDYSKRIYYRAYEVGKLLRPGGNGIGIQLADGWFAGYVGFGNRRNHYDSGQLRAKAELHIEYIDGSKAVIPTDETWKAGGGPLVNADFLQGETYDARREVAGWDGPGFDDRAWRTPDVGAKYTPVVEAAPHQGVTVFKEHKPVKITEPRPGVYVVDFGTNFAGVCRLKVRGKAGTSIKLQHAERLNPDGTVYTTNLRAARCFDVYVCNGRGVETYEPRFTFHGFQYVQVEGYPGQLTAGALTGLELTSAAPVAGAFASDDPMLKQLYHNICQTQRSNFIDIPTDCPQRDERLGWTGDAQIYVRTATCNNDVHAFFTKWLIDLDDAQAENGDYPQVAPRKVTGGEGGPAWSDAGTICPWTIYEAYGDRSILENHYEAMKRYVEYWAARSKEDRLPPDKFHCFGDWLSIGADTPKDVIAQAYFANSTRNVLRAARVLGRADDVQRYTGMWNQIKASFNKAYVQSDGRIKGNTQCVYVLAIINDLLDPEMREKAAAHLVADIESKGWHLSTGFVGTKDLMPVLSMIGRTDVAYRLIHNDTFPSWGFSIKHGATSIWERWNGWTPEQGFGDPGMNSFAHYSFGAVYQWMFEYIGGIRQTSPGYKTVLIAPEPGGKLNRARIDYCSIRGVISSEWKLSGSVLHMKVVIPPSVTATVRVPGGGPKSGSAGAAFVKMDGGGAVFEVPSGTYTFTGFIKR